MQKLYDDKRQIAGVSVVNLSGEFSPVKLRYNEKSGLCHPKVKLCTRFGITYSENHWPNQEIVISLLTKMVFALLKRKRGSFNRASNSKALLFFDVLKTKQHLKSITFQKRIIVLSNMFPTAIQIFFNHWTSQSIKKQNVLARLVRIKSYLSIERGIKPDNVKVDVKLTIVKSVHAGGIIDVYIHIQSSGSLVKFGFRKALHTEEA